MSSGKGGQGGQGGRAGKAGSARKGAVKGSGGQGRRKLEGRGPTPSAEARKGRRSSPTRAEAPARPGGGAARSAGTAARSAGTAAGSGGGSAGSAAAKAARPRSSVTGDEPEIVVGKNPIVEALRARVPATALYVVQGTTADARVSEAVSLAAKAGIALLEVTKPQLDRMCGGAVHQGLGLQVPAYDYTSPEELLELALAAPAPLLVALDGVTDPRNLGALVRSAAAFGAQGVLIPERRAAGMTASAWRTSAGAAARLPVARCTNLSRTLTAYKKAGLFVIGLAADGTTALDDLELATSPLVVVVGSEGDGLARLVSETCDLTVSIPMDGATESLNAGIAGAVVLAEVARIRRSATLRD
jgi:23S rRNA (guanosine2251-2'-O)-methyltransferase